MAGISVDSPSGGETLAMSVADATAAAGEAWMGAGAAGWAISSLTRRGGPTLPLEDMTRRGLPSAGALTVPGTLSGASLSLAAAAADFTVSLLDGDAEVSAGTVWSAVAADAAMAGEASGLVISGGFSAGAGFFTRGSEAAGAVLTGSKTASSGMAGSGMAASAALWVGDCVSVTGGAGVVVAGFSTTGSATLASVTAGAGSSGTSGSLRINPSRSALARTRSA